MTRLQLICDCKLCPRIDDRDSKLCKDKNTTPCSLPRTLAPFLYSTYSHPNKTDAIVEHTS